MDVRLSIVASLCVTLAGGLGAQIAPSGVGQPVLGPDFSDLLNDLRPKPTAPPLAILDLNLPALAPVPDITITPHIEPMAEHSIVDVAIGSTAPEVNAADQTALARAWVVNVNSAPEELLAQVPQLGLVRAHAIVQFRDANGPFGHPLDVMQVFGISEMIFEQLEDHLVCQGESTFAGADGTPDRRHP